MNPLIMVTWKTLGDTVTEMLFGQFPFHRHGVGPVFIHLSSVFTYRSPSDFDDDFELILESLTIHSVNYLIEIY